MSASPHLAGSTPLPVLIARMALVVGACVGVGVLPYLFTGEETEIVSYTAPKEPVKKLAAEPPPVGKPGRLWGAIVPLKTELWFFKVTGPIEDVKQQDADLRKFLESVRFDKGEPSWTLPEKWKQEPGAGFIHAIIRIPTDTEPLEFSVSRLVRGESPLEEQLLANVNRWRGQISLPPVTPEELANTTEKLTVAGAESTLVTLDGIVKPKMPGRGPFMQ